MRRGTGLQLLALGVLVVAAVAIEGQYSGIKNMPPLPPMPSGFQPENGGAASPYRAAGMGDSAEGKRTYDVSKCFGGKLTAHLRYSWMIGGAQVVVNGEASTPEVPAHKAPTGQMDEPAGKSMYRGGLLVMRKISTNPSIGIDATGACNSTLTTYSANWIAVVGGKMLNIYVSDIPGEKGEAQAIVDGLIDPLSSVAKNAK